jgi:Mg-chelatase subunit ChlD
MTLAAFENRKLVTFDDILISADFALSHRTRKGGFLEPATPKEIGEIFKAKAKDMKYVEKTGETSKDQVEKKKHLKGKALFWVKKGASEEEEEKLRKENIVKKIRKKWFNALFRFTSLLQGVFFGIGKRLKKGTKDMPVTNGVQKGSNKLRGETYNDKKEEKGEFRAIPSVSSALGYPDFSKGITLIGRLKRRITSPSQFLLKMGKIQAGKVSTSAGKRAVTLTTLHRGKPYLWKIPKGKPRDIHIPATIREATRRQKNREKSPQTALKIHFEDIREKLRLYKAPLTMIFVVDLSGSMLLNVDSVKAALLRLHEDAYRYRDRVGIVALKDTGAIIVQHPITNLRVVAQKLMTLHVSGFTPLATGMMKAREVLKEAKRRTPSTIPVMVIITDGSANVPLKRSLETGEIREIEEVRIIVRDYEDISIRDVISVSKMIKREGIHTIVINTNPHLYGRETYGFVVTKNIAAITNGSHHSIGRVTSDSEMIENMIEHIKLDQKDILHG